MRGSVRAEAGIACSMGSPSARMVPSDLSRGLRTISLVQVPSSQRSVCLTFFPVSSSVKVTVRWVP
jgi:hypothetical protein